MPNYCENVLEVTGKPEDLKSFKEFIKGDKRGLGEGAVLDFNKIIPYPKKFKDLDKKAKYREASRAQEIKRLGYKELRDIPDDQREKIWKAFPDIKDGYNSGGHDWCCANWGTKWNSCDPSLQETEKNLKYKFETAWSPPLPVIHMMGVMFPKLKFHIMYNESGMQFRGSMKVIKGEVKDYKQESYGEEDE